MLAAIGVGSLQEIFDRQIPEGVRLGRALELPAGLPEQEVYEHLRELAARNSQRRGRAELPRRRHVRPLRAGAGRHADRALGVPHALHALPARDLPGRAAGDVRVPDGDLRADRPAGRPTPRSTRGPRPSPPPATWPSSHNGAHALRRQRAACTRTRCETLRTYAHGYGMEVVEVPLTRRASPTPTPGAAAIDADTQRGDLRRSRTSTAPSRTPRRCARPAQARRRAASSSPRSTRSRSASCAPPGECGVDVAVGEGQSLGNRLDFGGPSFGLFAAREEYLRRMPGRIAGETARRRRPARLRAHAADARAAHPPREGDLEHLHRAGAQRARRRRLPVLAGPARASSSSASCCSRAPTTRARRSRRSTASSRCTSSRSCASSRCASTRDVAARAPRAARAAGRQPGLTRCARDDPRTRTGCSWRSPSGARAPTSTGSPSVLAARRRGRAARRASADDDLHADPGIDAHPHASAAATPLQRDRARTIFQKGAPGRRAFVCPPLDVPAGADDAAARRACAAPSRRGCPRSPSPRSCATTPASPSATSTSTRASTRSARAR